MENPSAPVETAPVPEAPRPRRSFAAWLREITGPRILGSLIALVSVGAFIYLGLMATDLPPLQEIENPESDLSTQVFASDGELLGNFFIRENRINVRLSQISPYVIDALVATEDARFYDHAGVDYWSIPAIVKRYLTGTTSGGSTITMQLARNLFNVVGEDRTINRKIKEVIVSAVLEKNYTKQEIMEAYLNTVNLYGNTYGIETSARRLFGKSASELKIEEATVMVAMLKGQGVFDPVRNPDTVIARRNLVMDLMVKHGFINSDPVFLDSLKRLPLIVAPQRQDHEQGLAPYFRQELRNFMKEWCKNNFKPDGEPYNLYTDGLRVYTTIDSRMQAHAEEAVRKHIAELQKSFDDHIRGREPYKYQPEIIEDLIKQSDRYKSALRAGKSREQIGKEFDTPVPMTLFSWEGDVDTVLSPRDSVKYSARFLETGVVAIDPANGQIKVWVGGTEYRHFKYDHVATGTRQVGSTFKPFVYAAAIDRGRKPCDRELNQPVVFENTDGNGARWVPKNSDGSIGGLMTLRTALATSTNLVTARLMKQLGPETVVQYAYNMGIKSKLDPVPALCLGAADLTVLELTSAYTTLVNLGQHVEPYYITRIEDRRGNVLAEFSPESKQVLTPATAYTVVNMLRGTVDEPGGTAHRLRSRYKFSNPIAGKTGTTQNHSDGWFMGLTPNLVGGVWVGCSDMRMRFRSLALGQGANMALPIWAMFMQKVYEDERIGMPSEPFREPAGYKEEPCVGSLPAGYRDMSGKSVARSSDDLDSFE